MGRPFVFVLRHHQQNIRVTMLSARLQGLVPIEQSPLALQLQVGGSPRNDRRPPPDLGAERLLFLQVHVLNGLSAGLCQL